MIGQVVVPMHRNATHDSVDYGRCIGTVCVYPLEFKYRDRSTILSKCRTTAPLSLWTRGLLRPLTTARNMLVMMSLALSSSYLRLPNWDIISSVKERDRKSTPLKSNTTLSSFANSSKCNLFAFILDLPCEPILSYILIVFSIYNPPSILNNQYK